VGLLVASRSAIAAEAAGSGAAIKAIDRWTDAHISRGTTMTVKIVSNEKGNPPGKLADAELHFAEGPLAGLRLIGFSVWERRSGGGHNVTFPARQYSVNGERRSFSLLRPIADSTAQNQIRDLILEAYAEHTATKVEATA